MFVCLCVVYVYMSLDESLSIFLSEKNINWTYLQ